VTIACRIGSGTPGHASIRRAKVGSVGAGAAAAESAFGPSSASAELVISLLFALGLRLLGGNLGKRLLALANSLPTTQVKSQPLFHEVLRASQERPTYDSADASSGSSGTRGGRFTSVTSFPLSL
jgi:hypothetical protein